MASTRVRFIATYTGVLTATLVAFSAFLWDARRSQATEDLVAQATAEADAVLATVAADQAGGKVLTTIDSSSFSLLIRVTQELTSKLNPLPGYFTVIDRTGRPIYRSTQVQQLVEADVDTLDKFDSLQNQAAIVPLTATSAYYDSIRALAGAQQGGRPSSRGAEPRHLLVISRPNRIAGSNIRAVIAGVPSEDADLAGELLLQTLVVLMPIALIVSTVAAYFVAGLGTRPVDQLINEVEAISDGRSLHRRLPSESDVEEVNRLSGTLNAMLSRLELSFETLRRFTADASHELKTPIAILRANIERAMDQRANRNDRMVALEESMQEIARMSDLVDDLLTLARIDEGKSEVQREVVHLDRVLSDVVETAGILGEVSGLTIVAPSIEKATVLGDEVRLRQLLLNLVTNAIKYTPRGGRVEIAMTTRLPGEVVIAVRDTGIGIAATDVPHIFERFWRADRARSRAGPSGAGGGSGLGLAISQWIAQAHGGTLLVQSRLGRGSVFTVVLPTAVADESVRAAQGESAISGSPFVTHEESTTFTDS